MIKSFLLMIIKRYKLHIEIRNLLDNERIYSFNQQVINLGSIIHTEASIQNHKNDKSKIKIGKGTHIRGELLVFKYGGKIEVGDNCYIGEGTRIWSGESIIIGNNVLISHNVNVIDTNSHEIDSIERLERYMDLIKNGHWNEKGSINTSPIVLKDFAWISFNSTILKGVTIGEGAIVGAGSVVTKDVPDFAVVAGNPAVIIKYTK